MEKNTSRGIGFIGGLQIAFIVLKLVGMIGVGFGYLLPFGDWLRCL